MPALRWCCQINVPRQEHRTKFTDKCNY